MLDYCFGSVISTTFAYDGFYNQKSLILAIISWVVLAVFSKLCKNAYDNSENKASYEVVYMLFLITFVPFTSMLCYGNTPTQFTILNIIFWFELLVLVQIKNTRNTQLSLKINGTGIVGEGQIRFITIISAAVVLYISGKYTHFRFNFSVTNVYELRADAASFSVPTFLTYLYSWTRNLNSILLAYYMRRKKKGWTMFCIFIQLLNFGIDGSKTTLFLLLFVVIINLLPKVKLSKMNKWVLIGFCSLMAVCVFANAVLNNVWPISLFVRRVLYVPVKISVAYVDFFTKNVPDFFRQGFLRRFGFESPYPPLSYMIAKVYWNEISAANNGLISDAITNMGIAGIFLFPVIFSAVLRWLDRSAKGLDIRIYLSVALYMSIVLSNSFLFTVLFTHGLLISIIVLKMMKREAGTIDESLSFD